MEPVMDTIDIGLGEKRASRFMLGTATLYNNKDCSLILNTAIEYGINTFDLAPTYLSNDKVKEWLTTLQAKDPETFNKLIFVIKGGFPIEYEPGNYLSQLNGSSLEIAHNIGKDLRESLAFYGLPKADIFILHRDDEDYVQNSIVPRKKLPVKSIFDAMDMLQPLYSLCAVSNWAEDRVMEFSKLRSNGRLINSSYFSLWERKGPAWNGEYQLSHRNLMDKSYLPNCINLTYSPLGGCYGAKLSALGFDTTKKQICMESLRPDEKLLINALYTDTNNMKYERLKELTEKINAERFTSYDTVQMTVAYTFAHPRVDGCFLSVNSVKELENNIQGYVLSKTLSTSDLDFLNPQ